MEGAKKVSVIICTYNARENLKECLDSLESQDYDQKEIIIVDDASQDGTYIFLQDFKARTKIETTVIRNEKNLGVAGSRNVGIKKAKGDIIAFTDADCTADAGWISELVRGYEHQNVRAVGGSIADKPAANIWELTDKGHDYVASKEGYVYYIQGCNMSFHAQVLRKFMFNEELKYGYEEALLCDDIIHDGHRIYYRPQAVVYHKRRSHLGDVWRRKYLLGLSSVWYRKKQNKFLMFKRHFVLLAALLSLPFSALHRFFSILSVGLFLVFALSLFRDEILFKKKTIGEILLTFPFLVFIELAHFWGSLAGFIKFRVRETPTKK
ncbi:MAG: glycosyltransferase family 2 protein [Candidatus Aminicenantes bacterium]